MRSRILVGTLWLLGVLAVGTIATSGDSVAPDRQWAVVNLMEPTWIGSTVVVGPVLIAHDDAKMARGEPCTAVYQFGLDGGPIDEVVSFMCIPTRRSLVDKFTMTTRPNLRGGVVLMEYQFAGDTEGHEVPRIP